MLLAVDYNLSQFLFSLGRLLPAPVVAALATYLIWALAGYVVFMARRPAWARAALSAGAALLFNLLITWVYFRARPFVDLNFKPIIDLSAWSKSFPSDHAAIAWSLAGTWWWQNKKSAGRWLAPAMAILISAGRVLAGVHYLSDVLAGGLIGWGASYLAYRYARFAR